VDIFQPWPTFLLRRLVSVANNRQTPPRQLDTGLAHPVDEIEVAQGHPLIKKPEGILRHLFGFHQKRAIGQTGEGGPDRLLEDLLEEGLAHWVRFQEVRELLDNTTIVARLDFSNPLPKLFFYCAASIAAFNSAFLTFPGFSGCK